MAKKCHNTSLKSLLFGCLLETPEALISIETQFLFLAKCPDIIL